MSVSRSVGAPAVLGLLWLAIVVFEIAPPRRVADARRHGSAAMNPVYKV